MRFRLALLAAVFSLAASHVFADPIYVEVPGGPFHSAIKLTDKAADALVVPPFRMRTKLVTNAEFLAFVQSNARWRRDRVAAVFASRGYLSHWAGPLTLGANAQPDEPVTRVTWFAARAYCASEQARLPHWLEWEYAASADAQHRDARADSARQARILAHLMASFDASHATPDRSGPNVYGLYDMHLLVGEWVDDYAALFEDADGRDPGGSGELRLCGGAALAFADRTDYAQMMRVSALAALAPADNTSSVGFRCVRNRDADTDNTNLGGS